MDIQNHYYGHSSAYASYCSQKRVRHVSGLIQHGWTVTSPVRAQFGDFADWGPKRRRLVWTSTSRAWSVNDAVNFFPDGTSMIDAVGAPYLYLLDELKKNGGLPARGERTLVLPMHGTALLKVDGDHAAYAQLVADMEGPADISLHIDDLHNPDVADAWLAAGHRLVSAGDRRDPKFLSRIAYMMAASKRVVSNRLSTSIMYAAVSGARVEVYGPDFKLGHNAAADPGLIMREIWPEFYDPNSSEAELRRLAEDELGVSDKRDPDDLKRLLGWDHPTIGPFLEYWASGPLTKAQTVLGLKKVPEGAHATEAGLSPWHWIRHPLKHLPSPLPKLPPVQALEPITL